MYLSEPTYSKMCSMHFYAWEKGLKTGKILLIIIIILILKYFLLK